MFLVLQPKTLLAIPQALSVHPVVPQLVGRGLLKRMVGDDDDHNENDHERSENVAVCNTSPQVQVN